MTTNKRKGGRPQNEVWEHYTQGERDSEGHASGTCNYCDKIFSRGDVSTLQGHKRSTVLDPQVSKNICLFFFINLLTIFIFFF